MSYHAQAADLTEATPVPLKDAAARMGISVSALRSRLKRGTVDSCKDDDGKILVYVPAPDSDQQPSEAATPTNPSGHAPSNSDVEGTLVRLIEAIQGLDEGLGNHDAAMERLMELHREQFESNSGIDSRLHDITLQMETMQTAIKTMGAAFRLHAQETDRLIKALNRSNSATPQAASFTPPAPAKQRLFGRRHTDQVDQDETPPSEDFSSS